MKPRSLVIAGIVSMLGFAGLESASAASFIGDLHYTEAPEPLTVSLFGIGLIVFAISRSGQNKNRGVGAMGVAAMDRAILSSEMG
jgi:hypothetical protein